MKKEKTFVIGDIHGGLRALKQCLERSKFDFDNDKLIALGDFCDGYPDSAECMELMMSIKNFIYVRGNHSQWCIDWLEYGRNPIIWSEQGGKATVESYLKNPELMIKHREFLKKTKYYYIDKENRCFVHGGVSQKGVPIAETDKDFLMWDRELWNNKYFLENIPEFKEVFVGHTSIWRFSHKPMNYANVWFLDLGGGWEGKLCIMDVDTKKFWLSDKVSQLYIETKHASFIN